MMNKALLTTAICFAACMPAWASSQDNATSSLKIQSAQDDDSDILNYGKQGTAPKEETPQSPLTGNASIDVKQETKPLDPLLWTGNYFDEKVATALLTNEAINSSSWKKIPAWQAGGWETTQATNTRAAKYVNGVAYADTTSGVYLSKSMASRGWQKDRNGDIWDWYHSGYWTETEQDNDIRHAFVKISMLGAYDYPDLYGESVDFIVDKSTGKITDVQQRKSWVRYISLAPGLVKQESIHTVYDEKGQPTESAWNTSLKKRIKTFEQSQRELASDKEYAKLIRELFVLYLKNNGLADLIPTSTVSTSKITQKSTNKTKKLAVTSRASHVALTSKSITK